MSAVVSGSSERVEDPEGGGSQSRVKSVPGERGERSRPRGRGGRSSRVLCLPNLYTQCLMSF